MNKSRYHSFLTVDVEAPGELSGTALSFPKVIFFLAEEHEHESRRQREGEEDYDPGKE